LSRRVLPAVRRARLPSDAMSGGYSSSTRVGNWSEERQARERQVSELLAKRAAGTLASDVHAARVAAGLAPVALPPRGDDGALRFGDVAVLCSATGGALAACVHDLTPSGGADAPACAAALAPSEAPVARVALQLERCAPSGCRGTVNATLSRDY